MRTVAGLPPGLTLVTTTSGTSSIDPNAHRERGNVTFIATILTLYPEMFPGPLGHSLAGRALREELWSLNAVQIRDFATDKHRSVDDTPSGGGAGMVMRADVLAAALDSVENEAPRIVLTPRAPPLTQARVRDLARGAWRDLALRPVRGDRRTTDRGARAGAGIGRRLHPVRRRDGGADPAGCLHSADPRRNGRDPKRGGRELRSGAARISAFHPTC